DGGMLYAHGAEVHWLQIAATHSAFLLAAAQVIFLVNLVWTLSRPKTATANPWDAEGSDWKPEEELAPAPASTDTLPATGFHTLRLATLLFIAASAMFFGALFSSYVFLREAAVEWPEMDGVVRMTFGPMSGTAALMLIIVFAVVRLQLAVSEDA